MRRAGAKGDRGAPSSMLAVVLLFLLSIGGTASSADPVPPAPESGESAPPRPHDTGLYIGAGWSREYLRLEFDQRALLPEREISWEEWGPGIDGRFGYRFSPRFRGELGLSGSWRGARPEGARAGYGMARLTGYVPLWTDGWLRPHLIGGFGAAFMIFHSPGEPDLVYLALLGDIGAGTRVELSRRWGLQVDFVHSVLDLQQETIDDGSDEMWNVGRRGRTETLRVGITYDF